MTEFVDGAREVVEARLAQLRDELQRLEAAAAALADSGARSRSGRSRNVPARKRPTGRRGRPLGGGARAVQAEKLVRANPGITIPDLAKRMKINPTYLYRVMPQLQKDGKVHKRGKEWHPV